MHFSTAFLALLASTTTATVLPSAENGSWAVSLTKSAFANGFRSESVTAVFTSDAYPDGITSTCKSEFNPANTPPQSSGCDNEAFSYEYDGTVIKLQQNVELPTAQTVFGEAPLELKADGASGRTSTGEAVVEVTSAIA